jgi:hypothetical protein
MPDAWVTSVLWAAAFLAGEYRLCRHLSNVAMLFSYRLFSNQTGH